MNTTVNLTKTYDHRKMIFFFNIKDEPPFDFDIDVLSRETKDNFINSIVVNAVLMGSSNQSFQTYFGGKDGIADKGEADILMFVSESEIEVNGNNMHVNGTITFKALDGIPSYPREYLKQILIDYLDVAIN